MWLVKLLGFKYKKGSSTSEVGEEASREVRAGLRSAAATARAMRGLKLSGS